MKSSTPTNTSKTGAATIMELGDLLVTYIEQLDVEYVFGIPGGAIEPFYNALARSERRGGPRAIVARHETGAAFMADGYARNTGRLGVCCATTGPGTTNLITGIASAYENHTPMLVITPQTALSNFGRGALQESSCTGINTVSLLNDCTHYSTLISHVDQFERKVATAIIKAVNASGPAHISVPMDIMGAPSHTQHPSYSLPTVLNKAALVDHQAVAQLVKELQTAHAPVFLIGNEADEAAGLILEAAIKLGAKIIVTPHGKGLVSPYHPLFRGVIGFSGHESAQQLLQDNTVDKIFVVGAHLGEWASNGWDQNLLNSRLIHIEENENNFTRTPMAALHVRGRIKTIFEQVNQELDGEALDAPVTPPTQPNINNNLKTPIKQFTVDNEKACFSDASPIKPQRLMYELPKLFPPNTHYLADSGNSFSWATHYLHPHDRRIAGDRAASGGFFQAAMEFASMGWAIGGAIGTAIARPGTPIVCIVGDGAMLMSGQEITVAVQEQLPVIFVVLNDSEYGMVKHGQRRTGAEPIAFKLIDIDFCAFAKAMGINAYVVESPKDLQEIDYKAICAQRGPTLLDVRIDREESPPIGLRTKILSAST